MAILVISVTLLGFGGKAWWEMAQYKAPVVTTYAAFARALPKSGWYTITDGVMDVSRSVYWDEGGVAVGIYAPLFPPTGRNAAGPDVYVEIGDVATRSAFQDMVYAKRSGGDAGARRFMDQHPDIFVQRRAVSGLVRFGQRDPMGEWERAGVDAANVTFISDGWKPNPPLAYDGTAVGLALTLFCLAGLGREIAARR